VRFSAKAAEEKGPWDVIIVGSGMGGLTCGSVLSQFGYKVMVLEAHEVAGGSTHDYNVDGKTDYKFPSGLHYTIPASEEMLQVSCGAARPPVRFARMGDDTVLHDGAYDRVRLTRTQDAELRVISDVALKKDLRARFPNLIPQLERFERVCTELLQAFPIWAALHAFPWSVKRTLLPVLLPSAWWRYAGRTAEDVFGELFADAPESGGRT
jgi:phytoene dehydrogenase-like protein